MISAMIEESFKLNSMAPVKMAESYISTSLHDAVKLRTSKCGLGAIAPQTIPQFFRECCQKFGHLPALVYEENISQPTEGVFGEKSMWKTITYHEYEKMVQQTSLLLLHVGLQPRSSVGILAFNCPEWFYIEMATLRAGGVVAGIYTSNSAEAVFHVLDTSEATICVVDDKLQMEKVRAIKSRLPRLGAVIQINGPFDDFVGVEEGFYRWEDLIQMEYGLHLCHELKIREEEVVANECAILIYTSGTVGMPKAVMLSHDAIIYDAKAIKATLPDIKEGAEVGVTFLPLNHVAAQLFDIYLMLEAGACVYFADRFALKGSLVKTIKKARPTRFFGVPRVFEKIEEVILMSDGKVSSFSKYLIDSASEYMKYYYLSGMNENRIFKWKHWLSLKILKQLQVQMGLDRCKSLIIGGAPVRNELKYFYYGLALPLTDVYGLSEASGPVTLHLEHSILESCGKALEGIELKIFSPDSDGQGEICVRGRSNFMGYLGDKLKTQDTIKDNGWIHTGDLGYLDTDGNLMISGRIKELIITSGGENIPPAHIEALIKRELPGISNAMVVGDHRKYLTVLLTIKTVMDPNTGVPTNQLSPESLEWMKSLDLQYMHLSEILNIPDHIENLDASNLDVKPHEKVIWSINEGIKRANQNAISNAQKIQKFRLLPHDFSIPTGELGPTLKIRRNVVTQKYYNIISEMYS